jgi:hypothetical protein
MRGQEYKYTDIPKLIGVILQFLVANAPIKWIKLYTFCNIPLHVDMLLP